MPFNFLGTMREAQWRCFRRWVLTERRGVAGRLKVIDAELDRIGHITVRYRTVKETVQTSTGSVKAVKKVTEERESFSVSRGSSLEKLVQAYIAMGGNPMSISLWLQPDTTQFTTRGDPSEDGDPNKPFTKDGPEEGIIPALYHNIVAPDSTDGYGSGGQYKGGLSTLIRNIVRIVGRYFEEDEAGAKIAIRMDHARRWVKQELSELAYLENRIIKLMDLREQLLHERNTLIPQAVGGSVPDFQEAPDVNRFPRNLHLTRIVTEMDRTFYKIGPDGEIDFSELNLRADDGSDPRNIVPTGISFYDTLTPNPPGTDNWAC